MLYNTGMVKWSWIKVDKKKTPPYILLILSVSKCKHQCIISLFVFSQRVLIWGCAHSFFNMPLCFCFTSVFHFCLTSTGGQTAAQRNKELWSRHAPGQRWHKIQKQQEQRKYKGEIICSCANKCIYLHKSCHLNIQRKYNPLLASLGQLWAVARGSCFHAVSSLWSPCSETSDLMVAFLPFFVS